MSTLALHTEQKAIDVLAQCISYFELLANLQMTAEDDFDVRQAENCLRRIIKDTKSEASALLKVNSLSFYTEDLYVLVHWPWVQELMGFQFFQHECYLCQALEDQENLDSSYFVPVARIIDIYHPM